MKQTLTSKYKDCKYGSLSEKLIWIIFSPVWVWESLSLYLLYKFHFSFHMWSENVFSKRLFFFDRINFRCICFCNSEGAGPLHWQHICCVSRLCNMIVISLLRWKHFFFSICLMLTKTYFSWIKQSLSFTHGEIKILHFHKMISKRENEGKYN